jgi:hypothetical protein
MLRLASVSHSRDGYRLHVDDVPVWAWAIDSVNIGIIQATCSLSSGWACPLCLCSKVSWAWKIGWGRDEDGLRRHSLGGFLFGLGQRGGRFCLKRSREVYVRPLTFDEMCERFPDKRVEWDDDGEMCVRGVLIDNGRTDA